MRSAASLRAALAAGLVLAGCNAMPPPPLIPLHAETAAAPHGATTAMLVVGLYAQLLGGEGMGLALRVEHQETERTAIGVELGGGRARGDGPPPKERAEAEAEGSIAREPRWLIAARTYGRFTPRAHDFVAITYGGGLSALDTGMVALTLHGGGALSYPNDYAVPLLGGGLAASIPLFRGAPFRDEPPPRFPGIAPTDTAPDAAPGDLTDDPFAPRPPPPKRRATYAKADLLPYLQLGMIVPIADTGNRLSLELDLALALRSSELVLSLSAADAHTF